MILLYRNHFYGPDRLDEAFGALASRPVRSEPACSSPHWSRPWATRVMTLAAVDHRCCSSPPRVVTAMPGGLYTQPAIIVAGFLTGFCAQGVKISVDTLVQTGVDDVYRGRVFSLYDMIFNVGQVSAAALGALILPDDGKSYAVLVFIVLGFVSASSTPSPYCSTPVPPSEPRCGARGLVRSDPAPASGRRAERGDGLDGGGLPRGVRTGDQADERTQQG